MREGVGKALRRAFGQEDLIKKLEPRKAGVSRLMNPKRRRIFSHLLRSPCSHLRLMSRELDIPTQTLKWHLAELQKAGILDSVPVGNRKCFFVPARIEREDVPALSHLSDEMSRKIVSLLVSRGPLSLKGIFTSLKTYYQAVQHRLKRLEEAGLIRSDKRGRKRTYEVSSELVGLRDRYMEKKTETSSELRKVLDEDGLSPEIVKTLTRSTVYMIDTGTGREEIELFLDPLAVLKG
ncbi:MAG: helix-turn-helix domain-containing protein [Candidatus Thermoplasmatota archaeon]|nr:helix-turn-helix domain-containing protein [Candidatus Thermoplasmatota archaeon]